MIPELLFLPAPYIYVFRTVRRINIDYLTKTHWLVCVMEWLCLDVEINFYYYWLRSRPLFLQYTTLSPVYPFWRGQGLSWVPTQHPKLRQQRRQQRWRLCLLCNPDQPLQGAATSFSLYRYSVFVNARFYIVPWMILTPALPYMNMICLLKGDSLLQKEFRLSGP